MKVVWILLVMIFSIPTWAQSQRPVPSLRQEDFTSNAPSNTPTSAKGKEYRIGADDLIEVSVFEVPELAAASRVTASGTISMPLIGPVSVAGYTPQEVERSVEEALKKNYVNDPHVTVFVREYASQPVSVLGAVKLPGIYQIKGQKSLLDMLAMAQGIDATSAGKIIQVIRAKGADQAVAASETLTVDIEDLLDNGKTELNIPIFAGDSVNVLRAGSVFVVGEVVRPNEFVLRNGKNVTVMQAVALANGTTREAKKNNCSIIRYHRDGTKEEIRVDLGKVLSGGAVDVTMMPNDILFVPAAKVKSSLSRALDSTISVAVGRMIYGGF
jgi:polysaccharide export outer membrane protein